MNHTQQPARKAEPQYDYSNTGRPRDFDIRSKKTEQKMIVNQSQPHHTRGIWRCSECDF
ncbi:MAG: hypothetical protein V7707_02700 [Motiliproteus sp.]